MELNAARHSTLVPNKKLATKIIQNVCTTAATHIATELLIDTTSINSRIRYSSMHLLKSGKTRVGATIIPKLKPPTNIKEMVLATDSPCAGNASLKITTPTSIKPVF
mmetsp:Transcript_37884/g.60722  ORF Transcript_37884/g.60722 Transcript_37884/m.60722 type:complete len:107 (-) Transcript_37884:19-339(-)